MQPSLTDLSRVLEWRSNDYDKSPEHPANFSEITIMPAGSGTNRFRLFKQPTPPLSDFWGHYCGMIVGEVERNTGIKGQIDIHHQYEHLQIYFTTTNTPWPSHLMAMSIPLDGYRYRDECMMVKCLTQQIICEICMALHKHHQLQMECSPPLSVKTQLLTDTA